MQAAKNDFWVHIDLHGPVWIWRLCGLTNGLSGTDTAPAAPLPSEARPFSLLIETHSRICARTCQHASRRGISHSVWGSY